MLTVKRPTPTTVLYTVSTRSPATSLAAHAKYYSILTARILAGSFTCLVAWAFIRQTNTLLPIYELTGTEKLIATNDIGVIAINFATIVPWPWLAWIVVLTTWLVFRKGYTEESLLVIRGLGVQTSTSSPTYLSTASTRFIATSMIQDIFIHEAFKGFEVRYYLSIVIEGEEDVVVVFPVSIKTSMTKMIMLIQMARTFCPGAKHWKMCGEARKLAYMSQSHDTAHRHAARKPSSVMYFRISAAQQVLCEQHTSR